MPILLLALLVASCRSTDESKGFLDAEACGECVVIPTDRATPLDYEVYSLLVDHLCTKVPGNKYVAIQIELDQPLDLVTDTKRAREGFGAFPSLEEGTIESFFLRNGHGDSLEKKLTASTPYRLISKMDFPGWDQFAQECAGCCGYVTLSKIGFNVTQEQAFLYFSHGTAGLAGRGGYALLQKGGSSWAVVELHDMWVS